MIISVQDNLKEIQDYFCSIGYETHIISENVVSDVYIYSESTMGLGNVYESALPTSTGAIFIDVDNKSNEDLTYMVEHRVYSPLF